MNQKEYNLIADVIRGRKENAIWSLHFDYSQSDIDHALATIADLQDMMAYELAHTYSNFDRDKFIKACEPESEQ